MQDYTIDVGKIEELQTIGNTAELDRVFSRAHSTLVNGASVHLARRREGRAQRFDTFTTLEDLEQYRASVYKYL